MKAAGTFIAMLAAAACERDGSTADTTQLVRSAITPASASEWRTAPTPRVRIGGTDADTGAYELDRVVGAYLLSDGRIVLGNGGTAEMRWYDSTGRFEKAVGREGQGPGEFELLISAWPMAGDSTAASDATLDRISIFSPRGEFVRSVKLEVTAELSSPNGWGHFSDGTIAGAGGSGLSLRPAMVGKLVGSEMKLARYDGDGKLMGEIARLPDRERYVVSTTGTVKWPFTPYSANPTYAVSGMSVFSTSGREFLIEERDPTGKVLRRIRADVPVQPLTSEHRSRFAEEMRAGARTEQDRVSTERFLAGAPFPEQLPVISRLLPTRDGMLWAQAYFAEPTGERRWYVLDRTGHWIGHALTPRNLRVVDVTRDRLLGVASDSLGIQSVLVFDLVLPERMRGTPSPEAKPGESR
jgi:hypothetical protein